MGFLALTLWCVSCKLRFVEVCKMGKIKEFYELADTYCNYVSAKEMTIDDISALMKLLMKLYLAAVDLPETDPETIDSAGSVKTDLIRIKFEEQIQTFYWEVFDPFVQEDAVCANLSEDLSEIAADLQNGMREFEAGRTGNAVFEWKFGLNSHWGNHAVDALRALHAIRIR